MDCCFSGDFSRLLGNDALEGSTIANLEGDTVHFMVTEEKQKNYWKYCDRIVSATHPVKTINRYTNHETEYYAKVNLALAADTRGLEEHADFIPQLRSSIFAKPLLDDGVVYRGVELSPQELSKMESLGCFFIPSFTSTSIESKRAYSRNSMMVIKLPYACQYACSITEELSRHYATEREVLIACYSAFRLERVERDNNTNIVSLYLDEHLSALDTLQ